MQLGGKVTLVTGAASGIGRAMAERFATEGARVCVVDVDDHGARNVAATIGGLAIAADVRHESQLVDAIDRCEGELGGIDLLCSNAGVGATGGVEAVDDVWNRQWQVNVMPHVYAARAVVPRMIRRGGGYLLHTASAAGLLTSIGTAPYAVAKHAVVALAEWLAITHGDDGIRVSCLCPQGVRTPLVLAQVGDPAVRAAMEEGMIEPSQCADAVVRGLAEERFLILPHPEVLDYFRTKAQDYDRWIGGMRKINRRFAP